MQLYCSRRIQTFRVFLSFFWPIFKQHVPSSSACSPFFFTETLYAEANEPSDCVKLD